MEILFRIEVIASSFVFFISKQARLVCVFKSVLEL